MKRLNFIVFDFESSSKDPYTTYPLQLSAIALDGHTLEIVENGEFNYYMRPSHIKDLETLNNDPNISDEALAVNGINKSDILGFADEKQVWNNFVNWCLKYAVGRKSDWDKSVPVSWNGINFDSHIVKRLVESHKTKNPFHKTLHIDCMIDWYRYIENLGGEQEVEKLSFDYCRQYLQIPENKKYGKTHNALRDCHDLVSVFTRFQLWKRKMAKKANLKGSFANG